jgi:glucose-1-phosphate adenylyltransferase
MRNVVTFVLGGGRGRRLFPLTQFRSKPAVPLAGKYRLIDVPLSNCINSEMRRIYLLTQFMSVSLHRHIRQTYRFDQFSGGFIEILAAQQTLEAGDWFQGTADAVRKNLQYVNQPGIDYVLILSGDQLYRMDYRDMLRTHVESKADATIAALPVTREGSRGLGVMRVDEQGRVNGFVEKPTTDEQINSVTMTPAWMKHRGIEAKGRECLASMGIYLFNRETLVELLESTEHEDFGKEVFPKSIDSKRVFLHLFDGYWRDIGTIRSFYDANLAMAALHPPFNLYVPESPVYSRARFLPPSRIDGAEIKSSMIADGCRIGRGAKIENSVIGLRCVIEEGATIRNSILMGADAYETTDQRRLNTQVGQPNVGVGSESVIVGSILDKDFRIGSGVHIENVANIEEANLHSLCYIRDRIPVIPKGAVIPDGWRMTESGSLRYEPSDHD